MADRPPVQRHHKLWAAIFNAIPGSTEDGRILMFSRRARMADEAWRIAQEAPDQRWPSDQPQETPDA